MKDSFYLAYKYLQANKFRSFILILCVGLSLYLPITSNRLVNYYQIRLKLRANQTPMLAGAPGSSYDLALNSLYFLGKPLNSITLGIKENIEQENLALVIPLYIKYHAKEIPIIGTSLEYFSFRHLTLSKGHTLIRLGDCLLGANAAKKLKLKIGDYIMSDPDNIFDISSSVPVYMKVTGILNSNKTADDNAIFTDLKTTWLIGGIMHGHADIATNTLLTVNKNNKIANASVRYFSKVTDKNINSFHFHCKHNKLPITSMILIPNNKKSGTILLGRYLNKKNIVQIIKPSKVINELINIIFKIKRFFDFAMIFLLIITLLFLILIVVLSIKIRESEINIMTKLGCSQRTVLYLIISEISIIFAASFIFSILLSGITVYLSKLYFYL